MAGPAPTGPAGVSGAALDSVTGPRLAFLGPAPESPSRGAPGRRAGPRAPIALDFRGAARTGAARATGYDPTE
ncbi:putative protein OS=Streptomyces fumanus OX=67302 GN=GCM10018772_18050 PE=4 SV=1 [Streptomyces fumanus]|uniref:Uncharacterized protein n=1 Tax=Streptomyces fumanus TaxID=67302 RepID=A0A919AAC9_9ACTN|nr:hypothetical protein GCM10018772_18050 [Streptomyces fumanus]